MSQDDPFAAADQDRTFIMPSPGGRPGAARSGASASPPTLSLPEAPRTASGVNPLVAAANPLLDLVPRLRASPGHADPGALQESLARGIQEYERRARDAGVAHEKVIAGRYALCTLLDETIGGTPWGGAGVWGSHSLLVQFHNEAFGGEKFFQLLARLAENPKANLDLLELMYVALALGFEGRYRVLPNGRAQLDALRSRLHEMIRKERGEEERALAAHWQPAQMIRNRVTAIVPLWVIGALAGVALVAIYMAFRFGINGVSDPVYADIQSIRVKTVRPPAPVEVAAPPPRLAVLLAPEIQRGLLEVRDEPTRSVVVLRGDGLFQAGSAEIAPNVVPVLGRVADALKQVPGKVLVTGHTDSQPIRTMRFPSNWHLSRERAQSVADLVGTRMGEPARVAAEGRAEAEPIAPNDTAANRALNRRVEITLQLPGATS